MEKIPAFLVLFFSALSVLATGLGTNGPLDEGGDDPTAFDSEGFNSNHNFYSDGRINPGGSVPSDYFGEIIPTDAGTITVGDSQYTLEKSDKLIKNQDGSIKEIKAKKIEQPSSTGEPSQFSDVSGGAISSQNSFSFERAGSIQYGDITISNGENIFFENDRFSIGHADTIRIKDGLLSQVSNFSGNTIEFSVGDAKNIINKCVSIKDAKDTHFIITDREITLKPNQGVNFSFTDCSYTESEFISHSNESELTISKEDSFYSLSHGSLLCRGRESEDKLEAGSRASVNYGSECFECMSISPIGTYHYIDPMIEKDFAITIPKEGKENYRLCLRKSESQHFESYDGQVNLLSKKIELGGITHYKRYPLKDGKVSDALTREVHQGKSDILAIFSYSPSFIYLDSLSVTKLGTAIGERLSMSAPSNFYFITEEMIEGEKKRTLLLDWKLPKEDLKDTIIHQYFSDDRLPSIEFLPNGAVQDNGFSRVEIFDAKNPRIEEVLR